MYDLDENAREVLTDKDFGHRWQATRSKKDGISNLPGGRSTSDPARTRMPVSLRQKRIADRLPCPRLAMHKLATTAGTMTLLAEAVSPGTKMPDEQREKHRTGLREFGVHATCELNVS